MTPKTPAISTFGRAVALILNCWLLAGSTPVLAQAQIGFREPRPSSQRTYTTSRLPIVMSYSGWWQDNVASFTAAVGTRTTTLWFQPVEALWGGAIDLSGLPAGEYTVVAELVTKTGETLRAERVFRYDEGPKLTVDAPAEFEVGHPEIPVAGQCVDDGPTCIVTITTTSSPTPLLTVTGSFKTVVTPPSGEQTLEFHVTDSTGKPFPVMSRKVFVSSKGGLSIVSEFRGTKILDINATRALVFDDTYPRSLRLYDRVAKTHEVIWNQGDSYSGVPAGFLTPNNGALFVAQGNTQPGNQLLEWRNGSLTAVGSADPRSLVVKGTWASFFGSAPCCAEGGLFMRDLTAGTNIYVTANAYAHEFYPHSPYARADITPGGHAFFFPMKHPHEILEFTPTPTPGAITQLTSAGGAWSDYPRTDGTNVVFRRTLDHASYSILLRTAAGAEEVLATGLTAALPDTHYQVAGGWTAFVRSSASGALAVWLREPDGTLRQVAAEGTVRIEVLSDTGDVAFIVTNGAEPGGSTRYLREADGTLHDLGVAFGQLRYIGGTPFLDAGNKLLAVTLGLPARSILSEGATGTFFSTDIALLNPAGTPVPVTLRYLREGLPEMQDTRTLPARSRTTIHLNDVPGLETAAVSTQVDAPAGSSIVAERLMTWDAGAYGGHLGNAVSEPRKKWYFAEGAQGFFATFFLLANSGTEDTSVRFKFLVELGDPVDYSMIVPAGSRKTFFAGDLAGLVNRSFATVIDAALPIVVERAMYFGDSPIWLGGHGSTGVPALATNWYHAEGATGSLFDTYILIANPNAQSAPVTVTFNTDGGATVVKSKDVPAFGRLTINIEDEALELANAAVSTRVSSASVPIVSERAMYWSTTGGAWREAHNSFGVTAPGLKWGLAEGRTGGQRGYQTYVLISNTTQDEALLEVTFISEDGTSIEQNHTVKGGERYTINASDVPQLADSSFATIVKSTNGVVISVESAIYWNSGGVTWEAGGNTVATPIP